MITREINISLKSKDAARPIAMLVQVASKFKSEVNIKQDGRSVNAKSIMGMMTLGLISGQEVSVSANGEDESAAIESIEDFLQGRS